MRQPGQGNVLAECRAEGDAGRKRAPALRVDQGRSGGGVHHRQVAQGITRHTMAVNVAGHDQGTERGRLVFALAELQVRSFAVEIGRLHLGPGQVAFEQVVLGQQVGVLQAQAFFHAPAVGVGLDAHRGDPQGVQRIPQGQSVLVLEVQFPALLAHIRDAEGQHRHACDLQVTQRRKREVLMRPGLRLVGNFLNGGARIRSPHAQTAVVRGGVSHLDLGAPVLRHAADPGQVAVAGIGPVDHAVVVLPQAQDGEVSPHATLGVQEVGVDTLAHRRVPAHLGHTDVLQQVGRIGAFHIDLGKVRDIDHAHVFRHLEMLGIRHAPEVAVIPLVGTHWHLIAVHREQMLVAGIAMGALPARQLHEVGAECLFALVERALENTPPGAVGLAVVHRRVVDLEGALVAAVVDVLLVLLVGVGAGHVDASMVDVGGAVGHPVGHQLADAGGVFHPHGLGVPEAAHLGRLTDRGVAVGGDLQQAVEGVLLVVPQFSQDGREFDRPLQGRHDLLELQVTLRRREPCFFFFKQIARVAHARVFFLVVAPLDLAAFGGLGVPGVAQVGRVALVAQQRVANVLAGTGEFQVGFEKGERVVHRHDRQVFTRHRGNQAPPQAGAHHHVVGSDEALGGLHALNTAGLDAQAGTRRVGKRQQLARGHRGVHQLARHHLRARLDQAGVRIPEGALNHAFFEQREPGLGLGRGDHHHPVAKGLARGDTALELLHAFVVPHTGHFQAANALVASQLVVEIDAVLGGEDRHLVVHRVEAKIRRVRRGADIGGDGGLVDADNSVPATFDQVVRHRGTHDATLTNDDDLGSFRKFGHLRLLLGKSVACTGCPARRAARPAPGFGRARLH